MVQKDLTARGAETGSIQEVDYLTGVQAAHPTNTGDYGVFPSTVVILYSSGDSHPSPQNTESQD